MIDLTINKTGLEHNLRKAKENRIIIPTIAQMQHPETIPEKIRERLKSVGLWDVDPLNLLRITWKNEARRFSSSSCALCFWFLCSFSQHFPTFFSATPALPTRKSSTSPRLLRSLTGYIKIWTITSSLRFCAW